MTRGINDPPLPPPLPGNFVSNPTTIQIHPASGESIAFEREYRPGLLLRREAARRSPREGCNNAITRRVSRRRNYALIHDRLYARLPPSPPISPFLSTPFFRSSPEESSENSPFGERAALLSPLFLFFTGEAFRIFAERLSAQSYPTERSNAVTKLIRRRYRAPPAISPRALKLRVKGTLLSSSPSSSLACVPRIALAERECEPSPRGGRVREGGKRARARRTRVVSGFEIATGLTRKQALCDLFRGYVPRLENCQPFFFPPFLSFFPSLRLPGSEICFQDPREKGNHSASCVTSCVYYFSLPSPLSVIA